MNPYQVNTSEDNIFRPLISLDVLYKGMPKTSGCEKCREINGDDESWCCKENNPSMYYVEFLRVWKLVQNHWSKDKKCDLFVRAIVNYLDTTNKKGCILWDKECTIYADRPLQCRLYGVIPQETWDKRINSIQERDKDFSYRPQCTLVSVVRDHAITSDEESKWFSHTTECEKKLGVPQSIVNLHDIPGGSYRTFHDHLLLEVLETKAMNTLTTIKISKPSKDDILEFAKILTKQVKDLL